MSGEPVSNAAATSEMPPAAVYRETEDAELFALVHEAVLEGRMLAADRGDVMMLAAHMKRLNERLVLRLGRVSCGFAESPWIRLGSFLLDPK